VYLTSSVDSPNFANHDHFNRFVVFAIAFAVYELNFQYYNIVKQKMWSGRQIQ